MNIAFADGSVKFIKDTINTRQLTVVNDDTLPAEYTPSVGGQLGSVGSFTPGVTIPGVWQALGTKYGGEVISSDALMSGPA